MPRVQPFFTYFMTELIQIYKKIMNMIRYYAFRIMKGLTLCPRKLILDHFMNQRGLTHVTSKGFRLMSSDEAVEGVSLNP